MPFQPLEEGVFLFFVYSYPSSLHVSVLPPPFVSVGLQNKSQWEHRVALLSIHFWLGALLSPWYRLVACVSIMTYARGRPPSSTPPNIHPSSRPETVDVCGLFFLSGAGNAPAVWPILI